MNDDHQKHAVDEDLEQLVFGEDTSQRYVETAAHVETCAKCLERLEWISGSGEIAVEASQLLRDFETSDVRFASAPVPNDRAGHVGAPPLEESLDFLEAPSHPEMLGRMGRFDVERVIGAGGMGVVLKAFDTELNRPVAVKVLAKHLAHSGPARQRFAREAKAAAAVVHEHVVAIHNVETEGDCPYIVMHYVAGESLQARVDRDGPLDAAEVLRIGIQAAAGLAAAHEQGVIHRDVKPANILLESTVERVLLTDFGLARTVDDASLTHTGIVTGTPHYMSPEQANGGVTDQRTDLFSLGAVLYFTATGHPPFRAERAMGVLHRICHDSHRPAWQVNSSIPDELSDVIDHLLQKKPNRRVTSATELRHTLTGQLQRQQRPGSNWGRRTRRLVSHLRRRRRTLGIAAAILLMLALASAPWWSGDRSSNPSGVADGLGSTADHVLMGRSLRHQMRIHDSGQRTGALSFQAMEVIGAEHLGEMMKEIRTHVSELQDEMKTAFAAPVDAQWARQVRTLKDRIRRNRSFEGQ